jgi:hypothetical protein
MLLSKLDNLASGDLLAESAGDGPEHARAYHRKRVRTIVFFGVDLAANVCVHSCALHRVPSPSRMSRPVRR